MGTINKQLKILENERDILISDQQRFNSINQNLETEKRDLHIFLDKTIKENDRLNRKKT